MAISAKSRSMRKTAQPTLLVVDDEPALVELMQDIVARKVQCTMITASDMAGARLLMRERSIDLMLTDVKLPDGDGVELIRELREQQPNARAMIVSGSPNVEDAISAMREGALDFVAKPFTADQLSDRVRAALRRRASEGRRDQQMKRLRIAVKRLNEARKVVSRKVDLLCNDLITAYGELSKQVDGVRVQDGFQKYVAQAKDLEQMLCHSMDWILRQVGYCNVAIWLAGDDDRFELGAYMRYSLSGDRAMTDAMRQGLVAKIVENGSVNITPASSEGWLNADEQKLLAGQSIIGHCCTYLGEPLAAIVLFRTEDQPFDNSAARLLNHIAPTFAGMLASIVREGQAYNDALAAGGEPDESESEKHDSDWWKRGEEPPF